MFATIPKILSDLFQRKMLYRQEMVMRKVEEQRKHDKECF